MKTHIHRLTVHWGDCDPADATRIKAIPIPEDLKALCL
jgi:hypothetical protein